MLIGYENLFSPQLTICWSLWKKNTETWERENGARQEAKRCVGLLFKSLSLHNVWKQNMTTVDGHLLLLGSQIVFNQKLKAAFTN